MSRRASVIGQAVDYQGQLWDIRDSRVTPHGWPLLLGWPADGCRGQGGGGPRAIITGELANYLESMRQTPAQIDLPLGRTAIKRLRKLLGHHWPLDNESLWRKQPERPDRCPAARHNWRNKLGIKSGRWTAEEDEILTTMQREGASPAEISRRLTGRTPQSVRMRMWRLGGGISPDPEE